MLLLFKSNSPIIPNYTKPYNFGLLCWVLIVVGKKRKGFYENLQSQHRNTMWGHCS